MGSISWQHEVLHRSENFEKDQITNKKSWKKAKIKRVTYNRNWNLAACRDQERGNWFKKWRNNYLGNILQLIINESGC